MKDKTMEIETNNAEIVIGKGTLSKRKKQGIIIAAVVCAALIIAVILMSGNSVGSKIRRYCSHGNKAGTIIRLSDFTSFKWDRVVIYKSPVTADDITDAAGVEYKREPDLQSGMIFLSGDKIVHEELFDNNVESPPKFFIYPYDDINSDKNISVISVYDAYFICDTGKGENGFSCILTPA